MTRYLKNTFATVLSVLSFGALQVAIAQTPPTSRDTQGPDIELVDPGVLRVCADPKSLPFSNEKAEGFENKIADVLAAKLGRSVAYTWYPQTTGFVRNTLWAHRCDVIIGFPQGDDLVQGTNPYYRSVYTLVYKAGGELEGVDALSDERLKGKRIGVVAGTPPATNLALHDLIANAKPYRLMVDTRVESSGENMINDLVKGEIDAAVLWGPLAGHYAKLASTKLDVVPLLKEQGGPALAFRITMGVRATDQNWKRLLNRVLAQSQNEIYKIILGYGVPLLDDKDQLISEASLAKGP